MPRRKAQTAETVTEAVAEPQTEAIEPQAVAAEAVTEPQAEVVPTEPTRLDMLEAFTELVSERWGYWMGRRLVQQEMGEKCQNEIKAVREKSKALNENVEKLIEAEDPEVRTTIQTLRADLKRAKDAAGAARKPFQDKIAPLAQAQKYCDNVAIPDSLKELGHAVQPRFSLSKWVGKAVEQSKKKGKK